MGVVEVKSMLKLFNWNTGDQNLEMRPILGGHTKTIVDTRYYTLELIRDQWHFFEEYYRKFLLRGKSIIIEFG